MYADTADYNEWRTGRRATGMTFAAATFSQKLGTAVAVGVDRHAVHGAGLCGQRRAVRRFPGRHRLADVPDPGRRSRCWP